MSIHWCCDIACVYSKDSFPSQAALTLHAQQHRIPGAEKTAEVQMAAAFYEEYGKPSDVLKVVQVPKPVCGKRDVLIKVKGAGVNPVDWKLMAGYIKVWAHKAPFIPGWDVAGVIEAVGQDVTQFTVGDEVYSYHRPEFDRDPNDVITTNGCIAEYVSVPEHRVALKPTKATWTEAAAIPLAALTAYQGLHDFCKITKGSTVLVTGGSGGVGGFGVQFAHVAGATVISSASSKNMGYVEMLGADHIIDYRAGSVADQVRKLFPDGVDFVFDAIGGDDHDILKSLVKSGGAHCSVKTMLVRPSQAQLVTIANLFDKGMLEVQVHAFAGLGKTIEAFEDSIAGRTVGKLVISV